MDDDLRGDSLSFGTLRTLLRLLRMVDASSCLPLWNSYDWCDWANVPTPFRLANRPFRRLRLCLPPLEYSMGAERLLPVPMPAPGGFCHVAVLWSHSFSAVSAQCHDRRNGGGLLLLFVV